MQRLRTLFAILWTVLFTTFRRLFTGAKHPRWTFRFEVVVEVLRKLIPMGARAQQGTSGRVGRENLRGSAIPSHLRAKISREKLELAGLSAEQFTPDGWQDGDSVIYYLHGGGYSTCSPATHRDLISRIAHAASARCVALDYRKAPAHPYPAAIEDAVAGYHALLGRGVEPGQLLIAGDSAGGGLSLATLLRLREAGEPLPAAALLLSPWVDLEISGASYEPNGRFDYLNRELVTYGASVYLQGADPRDPLISAVHADLSALPPMLVQTGAAECFLSENETLVERARAAGVDVVHQVHEGMVHVFQAFAVVCPQALEAIDAIGAYVREVAATSSDSSQPASSQPAPADASRSPRLQAGRPE